MAKIQEIFNPIKGFDGFYEVSQIGRVKSIARTTPHPTSKQLTIKERILKQGIGTNGYNYVVLRKGSESHTVYIHRIVAIHFVDNPEKLPQVNHIDGNKQNNTAMNLEWCDASGNLIHAYKTGLQKERSGSNNPNYKHGRFTLKKQPNSDTAKLL